MSQSSELSIVIVNWNTRRLLEKCLETIYCQDQGVKLDVIVLDNASLDHSAEMVRQKFPQVRLIENTVNMGFARANNLGFRMMNSRYVLLLNSDTEVLAGALRAMTTFLDEHSNVGVVSPLVLNPDGSRQPSYWHGFPSIQFALADCFYLWKLLPNISANHSHPKGKTLSVDHVLGACMMVRKEVVDQVGGMDESYFLFLEETDWCYRIKKAGWGIHVLPDARIIHIGRQSVNQDPSRTLQEKYRNYVRFYRKIQSQSRIRITFLKAVIAFACLLRIGLWGIRYCSQRDRELAARQCRGYWMVLKQLASY